MSLNLAVILRESAKRDPDHVAIILDSFKFTYGQLEALSNQVASSLKAAGVKKGDRVGLMLPNVPQFPMAYFGILKAAGVEIGRAQSELQSQSNLVCRLLLEKKKKQPGVSPIPKLKEVGARSPNGPREG